MLAITDEKIRQAEQIVKAWVKTPRLRKQALEELAEQVAMLQAFADEEEIRYLRWVTGEPPIHLLSKWVRVDGHDVRALNRAVAEALGL